jgi:hypothetical protein
VREGVLEMRRRAAAALVREPAPRRWSLPCALVLEQK